MSPKKYHPKHNYLKHAPELDSELRNSHRLGYATPGLMLSLISIVSVMLHENGMASKYSNIIDLTCHHLRRVLASKSFDVSDSLKFCITEVAAYGDLYKNKKN